MDFYTQGSRIIVEDTSNFVLSHILESGQVFRYTSLPNCYQLITKNLICILKSEAKRVIIESNNNNYFIKYFDLHNNYTHIKEELAKFSLMRDAISYGYGIRILGQWELEVIISFIISSNNNIGRIQKIIGNICASLGKDMGGWHAFPTLEQLSEADTDFFVKAGAGYRAPFLVKAIADINNGALKDIDKDTTELARASLMQLAGIGRKVADCILLFAYGRHEVFPVDTWLDKAYCHLIGKEGRTRAEMSAELEGIFGKYAGYAQQYLFYFYRKTYKNMEDE